MKKSTDSAPKADWPKHYGRTARPLVAAALLSGSLQACTSQMNIQTPSPLTRTMIPANEPEKKDFFTMPSSARQKPKVNEPSAESGTPEQPAQPNGPDAGPVIETPEMVIVAKSPNGPWPRIPKNCVYTGIVLEHNTEEKPHHVVLENMCYRDERNRRFVYGGYNVTVQADDNGHYDLPFHDAHLEEQGSQLYFVLNTRDRIIREVLETGQYDPNTLSFEFKLDRLKVRAK